MARDREFDAFMENLRAATDVVSLVQSYVPSLARRGKTYKGLCPFHQEKTPSFTVDPDKKVYHCFGCGAGGDAVHFVMQIEKLGFIEAVKVLAERAGMQLPERRSRARDDVRDRLIEVCELACQFYEASLKDAGVGSPPVEWLQSRGVDGKTAKAFRLGYAPNAWDALLRHASARGVDLRTLAAAGLAVEKEDGGGYDRFRNRVMFPIANLAGRVVAFGGRALLPDESAKYINSPETALYTKGEVLYGLNLTRTAIRHAGHAVLVEGYMDFLSVYRVGVETVVATSGTALTESQARRLSDYARTVTVLYDGDEAGRAASERAVAPLLKAGADVLIAALPDGVDPDDFARTQGASALRGVIDAAVPWFRFIGRFVDFDALSAAGQTDVIKRYAELVSSVPDRVRRDREAHAVADYIGVSPSLLEVRRGARARGREDEAALDRTRWEAELLRTLIVESTALERAEGEVGPEDMTDPAHRSALSALLSAHDEGVAVDPAGAAGGDVEGLDPAVAARVLSMPGDPVPIDDALDHFRLGRFEREMRAIRVRYEDAVRSGDEAGAEALLVQMQQLHRAIERLKGRA